MRREKEIASNGMRHERERRCGNSYRCENGLPQAELPAAHAEAPGAMTLQAGSYYFRKMSRVALEDATLHGIESLMFAALRLTKVCVKHNHFCLDLCPFDQSIGFFWLLVKTSEIGTIWPNVQPEIRRSYLMFRSHLFLLPLSRQRLGSNSARRKSTCDHRQAIRINNFSACR